MLEAGSAELCVNWGPNGTDAVRRKPSVDTLQGISHHHDEAVARSHSRGAEPSSQLSDIAIELRESHIRAADLQEHAARACRDRALQGGVKGVIESEERLPLDHAGPPCAGSLSGRPVLRKVSKVSDASDAAKQ